MVTRNPSLERHRILIDKVKTMNHGGAATSPKVAIVADSIISSLDILRDSGFSSVVIDRRNRAALMLPAFRGSTAQRHAEPQSPSKYPVIASKAVKHVIRRIPQGFKPHPEEWRQIEDNLFERIRRRFPAGLEPDAAEWRQIRDTLFEKIR